VAPAYKSGAVVFLRHKLFMTKITSNILVLIIAIAPIGASGCAATSMLIGKPHISNHIAGEAGFEEKYVTVNNFTLKTYRRFQSPCENLRVYIEGDGKAWKTRSMLSDDPTPSNPIALRLAVIDSHESVAYIARPGQFPVSDAPRCDPIYWSERRFAPEVVEAVDKAIDMAKQDACARRVEIVGYSGGAALAVLVAAGREDVASIRTIAGNLDHIAAGKYHGVSPLKGSLNPIDFASAVAKVPQRHFVGSRDRIIPSSIAESFVRMEGDKDFERITVVKGATHKDGWCERWAELLLVEPSMVRGLLEEQGR